MRVIFKISVLLIPINNNIELMQKKRKKNKFLKLYGSGLEPETLST